MISILIPVYNVEKYLRQCLDSILHQDFVDFEVILVNDGSTDASPLICSEYVSKDSRFRLVHQENQGFGAARNTGLKFARGEYVYFMDSDDKILPGLLSDVVKQFSECHYDTVFFGFRKEYVGSKNVSFDMVPPELDCQDDADSRCKLAQMLARGFGLGVWQQVFNKEFLLRAEIEFPTLKREADIAFLLTVYQHLRTFRVIPKVYYCYHAFYAPHKNNPSIRENHIILYRLLYKLLQHPRASDVEQAILFKYFVLWFCHVVPLHIYLNSTLSVFEKVDEFRKLLTDTDFRGWHTEWKHRSLKLVGERKVGLLQRLALKIFGLNSPVLAYCSTGVNYFLKFRIKLNYKKLYYR